MRSELQVFGGFEDYLKQFASIVNLRSQISADCMLKTSSSNEIVDHLQFPTKITHLVSHISKTRNFGFHVQAWVARQLNFRTADKTILVTPIGENYADRVTSLDFNPSSLSVDTNVLVHQCRSTNADHQRHYSRHGRRRERRVCSRRICR